MRRARVRHRAALTLGRIYTNFVCQLKSTINQELEAFARTWQICTDTVLQLTVTVLEPISTTPRRASLTAHNFPPTPSRAAQRFILTGFILREPSSSHLATSKRMGAVKEHVLENVSNFRDVGRTVNSFLGKKLVSAFVQLTRLHV